VVLQEAVVTTDTDALVQTVRETLDVLTSSTGPVTEDAFTEPARTALDALITKLEACEEREVLNLDDATGVRATRLLERKLERALTALLTVAKDAHGPGYPDQHSFGGGPVKMHGYTLTMVDAAIAEIGGKL
jgi:hypothetical protein